MPIIKSAKKAQRQTKKRTSVNKARKEALSLLVSKFKKNRKAEQLPSIFSLVDKLAKTKVIHKNKARRIKSRLAKSIKEKTNTPSVTTKKKTSKKAA